MIGDAELIAPAECRFDAAPASIRLDLLESDLSFPLTAAPLSALRRRPESIHDGNWRCGSLRNLWEKPFSAWTGDDLANPKNLSIGRALR